MYCTNCGTQLADDAAFCHNCGAKQGGQPNAGNMQTVIPEYEVWPEKPKKKKKVLRITVAIILIATAVFAVTYIFGEKKPNLEKFDEENENTISTSRFEEFASNERGFEMCQIFDYTEEEDPYGHSIFNMHAMDINRHDILDGAYLSIYQNGEELEQYAYEDILEITQIGVNTELKKAIKSLSEDFYYFEFGGGMFGDHSYCFYLKGNSMVYAIQCLQSEKDAYSYLVQKDTNYVLDWNIPNYHVGDNDLIDFRDQFLEDLYDSVN